MSLHRSALRLLRCPDCGKPVTAQSLGSELTSPEDLPEDEISEGALRCPTGHAFPIVRGVPRMLPDAPYDQRTGENFSHEWERYEVGELTWGMDLDTRVRRYFLEALGLSRQQLEGMVMLDAGCGNGSQSVAYADLGLEVFAVDLSLGLEHGQRFRRTRPGGHPERVHFVQGDLQTPPLAHGAFDIIHSVGVLHHTPDTRGTFRALLPLLRSGGTFYVWLYKYEPVVTPLVNGIRSMTTRVPPALFARLADAGSVVFQLLTRILNALGIRSYSPLSRRHAALALMDIFGAPHAHYHSFAEVTGWFRAEGFEDMWLCNDDRRGFGVCGRLPSHDRPVARPAGDSVSA